MQPNFKTVNKFKDLGLQSSLLKAIDELGFVNPTPIQNKSIPIVLNSSRDLIALAQTGTGKTAAFGLPLIQQIELKNKNIQTIVLCPTRELCIQISKDLISYSKLINGLKIISANLLNLDGFIKNLNILVRGSFVSFIAVKSFPGNLP